MLRESVQSWTQEPWSLLDTNTNNNVDSSLFDANSFLNSDQFQLQDLFGHDSHDFDRDASLLYDEFTFVPETNSVETIEPSDLINSNYADNIVTEVKRRRSSCCSTTSTCSSSSSSSSENEEQDHFSFDSHSRRMSDSDSSDSEVEQPVVTPYLHRRQMEEMILDKITNQLDPEKLPGILTIISKTHGEEEEVEIDLANLDRDQLERILSYVNDCFLEKQGGPKVKLSNYTLPPVVTKQPLLPQQQMSKNKRKRNRNRRRSSVMMEGGHIVSGSMTSQLSNTHGPISMSALTALESTKSSKSNKRKRRAKKNKKKDDDVSVHMSANINPFKESIASTKPKRKSAVHKRRLLEDMLQPSSNNEDSSEEEESGIIVFGDEQMDMAVTQNETIVHQHSIQEVLIPPTVQELDEEDDDELIDIMM